MWNQFWRLRVWPMGMVMSVHMMAGDLVFSQEDAETKPTTGEPVIHVRQERISIENAGRPTYPFQQIPDPVKKDIATKAEFTLVAGRVDANSGGLSVLHDDRLPKSSDSPAAEDFDPPKQFSIVFHANMEGVAHVQGTRMSCAVNWFRRNLEGEAKGAVVHELVHIVQQYGQARRNNRRAASTPGWVVEGVATTCVGSSTNQNRAEPISLAGILPAPDTMEIIASQRTSWTGLCEKCNRKWWRYSIRQLVAASIPPTCGSNTLAHR